YGQALFDSAKEISAARLGLALVHVLAADRADSFALELVFEWRLEYLNFSLALSIEHVLFAPERTWGSCRRGVNTREARAGGGYV
ncbi:hypothetical protein L917_08435, partial [Phytophthora nicotianae]